MHTVSKRNERECHSFIPKHAHDIDKQIDYIFDNVQKLLADTYVCVCFFVCILIIISRCQSRLWVAVISIDIITSTRFLQTRPRRLINSHRLIFSRQEKKRNR